MKSFFKLDMYFISLKTKNATYNNSRHTRPNKTLLSAVTKYYLLFNHITILIKLWFFIIDGCS